MTRRRINQKPRALKSYNRDPNVKGRKEWGAIRDVYELGWNVMVLDCIEPLHIS